MFKDKFKVQCTTKLSSKGKTKREYILCAFCFEVSIYVLKITSNEVNDTAVLMGMRNTKNCFQTN